MFQTNNPLASLIGLIRNGNSPQAVITQLAETNPQAQQVVKMMRGKSPEQLRQMAINMAKEQGVDINDILRQLGVNAPSYK